MRLSKISRLLSPKPSFSPADERKAVKAGAERFVWESLAPRLIHPDKRSIIEALIRVGKPLSPRDLAQMLDARYELIDFHCKYMARAGVLEIAEIQTSHRDAEEPCFFFPFPDRSSPPPRSLLAVGAA